MIPSREQMLLVAGHLVSEQIGEQRDALNVSLGDGLRYESARHANAFAAVAAWLRELAEVEWPSAITMRHVALLLEDPVRGAHELRPDINNAVANEILQGANLLRKLAG